MTERAGRMVKEKCDWYEDGEDSFWQTSCGHAWEFNEGGPKENGAKFCMYCGNPIKASRLSPKGK